MLMKWEIMKIFTNKQFEALLYENRNSLACQIARGYFGHKYPTSQVHCCIWDVSQKIAVTIFHKDDSIILGDFSIYDIMTGLLPFKSEGTII